MFSLSYGGTRALSYGGTGRILMMVFNIFSYFLIMKIVDFLIVGACYALSRVLRDRRLGVSAPTTCSAFLLPTLANPPKPLQQNNKQQISSNRTKPCPITTYLLFVILLSRFGGASPAPPRPKMKKNVFFHLFWARKGGFL